MEEYRIYRLNHVGGIEPTELIEAVDDHDAIRQARALGRNALKCELWQNGRLVLTLSSQELED